MLKIIINNKNYYFNESMTILQACEKINIHIPKFCYHDKLSIAGNCRMCLVEVEKSPKPVASCAMPLNNNMKIFTESALVKKARENTLESLLINHPLDCPICDQGGECDLQDQTLHFGLDRTRYFENKRGVEDKEVGPIIKTIMTRCIHCTKCIRFCNEVLGQEYLGTLGRSSKTEIGTYISKFIHNEMSGNLIDLCPVGALTSKPYAYLARPWELISYDCIDFNEAIGNSIKVYTRTKMKSKNLLKNSNNPSSDDRILRILPKVNDLWDDNWISDKSRFFYDSNSLNRISDPYIKNSSFKKLNWYDVLDNLKYSLQNKTKSISIFGKSLDMGSCYYFFKFSKSVGIKHFYLNNELFDININNPLNYRFNENFYDLSKKKNFIFINTNLRFESSILNLKVRKNQYINDTLIYQLGFGFQNFYRVVQIGHSILDILKFIEGKLLYNKYIKSNKHISILYGEHFFNSSKYNFDKRNLLKRYLNCSNDELNIIYSDTTAITLNELGIKNYAHIKQKHNFHNLIGVKNMLKDLKGLKGIKNIIDFNTHKDLLQSNFKNMISLPLSSLYEQNAYFNNMQGKVKISKKCLSNNKNSKNFLYILNMILINSFGKRMSKLISKKNFLLDYPKLIDDDNFTFFLESRFDPILRNKEFTSRNPIKNFFKTNIYNSNSLLLSDVSIFLKTSGNLFKKDFKLLTIK